LVWRIELTASAKKQLAKLDKTTAKHITAFLRERLALVDDPRSTGKALTGPLGDYLRYRVGDYRLICNIQDVAVLVLVVVIMDRKEAY
jgi:mRNA interferase RelE/StbE